MERAITSQSSSVRAAVCRWTSRSTEAEVRSLLSDAERLLDCLATRGHVVVTLEDAMETDRALGLSPDAGKWSCREDLRRAEASV
jgi:hypothetical protein